MPVTGVVISDGRHSHRSECLAPEAVGTIRHAEMVEAARRLGLPDTSLSQLGYEDQSLGGHEDELVNVVRFFIVQPWSQEVYVTCAFEQHADHSAVCRAVRQAVRLTPEPQAMLNYPGVAPVLGPRQHRKAQPNRLRAGRRRPVAVRMHASQGAVGRVCRGQAACRRCAWLPTGRQPAWPPQNNGGSNRAFR
jgi:LmbE family N-acetylglucosaminyl deacetylase